ncbi:unnamed protein product [Diatraea saccharalis]|uniref:Hemolin n=1 Tax=Diatraea saccharalis TaxID=40085 RepID=A0A9P0G1Y3_9NEOP|nr:unnamed protein product [Diatraea saccharalis]
MELRRLSLCLALFMLAIIMQRSDAHSMRKRDADDAYEGLMGDEANDDETQNDAEGGNDPEEEESILAVIQTLPTVYNVTVGKTIRLECRVEPADGPVIQWSRNKQPLFMGHLPMISKGIERFSIAPNSNDLLISDVKPSDSDVYNCSVLQNPPVEIEHTLSVHEAPRIVRFSASDNGTVVEGSDLLLTCDVAGSPPPQIMWSKETDAGNVRLQETDGNFSLNSVFIQNIKREQAGKYYCYAINGVGNAQAELTVKVLHKPQVRVHHTVINSAVQVEAVLQCSAHGEPTPSISWYKDGSLVDSASQQYVITRDGPHSNLTVVPQMDQDFGTFTCVARNNHGKHNKSIELVQRPVVEELDVVGNKLTWKVHSHQPLETIELQLRDMAMGNLTVLTIPVPTSKGHEYEVTYVLDNLTPAKYEAVVKAKNTKEWSRNSDPMVVEYEAQPMYIQHASVLGGNSHSVRPSTVLLSTVFMYLLVRMF